MNGALPNQAAALLGRECDLFFERVPCYVTIIDRNFRIVRANEKFRVTFGETPGRYCYEAYKRRKAPCPHCPAALTFKDGVEHVSNQVGVHQDGSPAFYVVTTSPLSRGENGVAHVIEMATDITQVRHLEDQLRKAHDFYESLVRHSSGGILALDTVDAVRIMNPAARALLDWQSQKLPSPERLRGMLPEEFYGADAGASETLSLPETMLRDAEGKEVPVRFSVVALKSHGYRRSSRLHAGPA